MRAKITLIGVAAVVIFAVGCGGGGNSTSNGATTGDTGSTTSAASSATGNSKPLTKTEFNTRINEICIQVPPGYEEKVKELEKGGKKLSKAEGNLKAALPPLHAAIEQMEAVTPPPGEEQKLEETIAALNAAAKGVEEEPSSELSGPKSPFAEFQKLTKEFGFETCTGL